LLSHRASRAHVDLWGQSVLKSSARVRDHSKAWEVGLQLSLKCDLADVTSCDFGREGFGMGGIDSKCDSQQGLAGKSLQAAWWRGEGNGEMF